MDGLFFPRIIIEDNYFLNLEIFFGAIIDVYFF
jgi:hypothetical protein